MEYSKVITISEQAQNNIIDSLFSLIFVVYSLVFLGGNV